ncbi:MAG: NAD(P)H-hydrate dehydratase [Legionellaceae bacterium]|nr:NAD(P)H-hydrate dehydratase [Legionellaceae bacterium]MBP9775938.1 NAD(P)H-hydrate dehydratase [Legionellaceae bacterium]
MLSADALAITLEDVQSFLKPRPMDAHKGLFGRVLVVGGDYGMPGAVRIAAEGALRVGAGLVTVLTRSAHIAAVVSERPELLCYGTDVSLKIVPELLAHANLVVLGSGLGQSAWSQRLFDAVFGSDLPKVIDADGLNWLARMQNLSPSSNWILTPHPGEAARMLGKQVADIQNNRSAALLALQNRYGGVIVLKGAGTLLMGPDQKSVQCLAGNPAMASAGMGDVLSGLIAGLVGQGLSLWEAAQAGVVMHATAADRVVAKRGSRGLLALDLLPELANM